jgi:hypothetical protein
MADSRVGRAIDRAFSILGEPSKQALIYYLQHNYNMDIYQDNVSIQKLESSLKDLVGEGKDLLMSFVDSELRKL